MAFEGNDSLKHFGSLFLCSNGEQWPRIRPIFDSSVTAMAKSMRQLSKSKITLILDITSEMLRQLYIKKYFRYKLLTSQKPNKRHILRSGV